MSGEMLRLHFVSPYSKPSTRWNTPNASRSLQFEWCKRVADVTHKQTDCLKNDDDEDDEGDEDDDGGNDKEEEGGG